MKAVHLRGFNGVVQEHYFLTEGSKTLHSIHGNNIGKSISQNSEILQYINLFGQNGKGKQTYATSIKRKSEKIDYMSTGVKCQTCHNLACLPPVLHTPLCWSN